MTNAATLTLDEVYEALRDVYDPEIPVNIVDLGLVRDVKLADGNIDVQMTLTFAGCGMGPYIAQQAEWRLAELEGVDDINVDLVFDPPWTPDEITDEGKKLLGLDYGYIRYHLSVGSLLRHAVLLRACCPTSGFELPVVGG